MKKWIAIVLCVLLCMSLAACSKNAISGTWEYSRGEYTSTVKFYGNNRVDWTLKSEEGEESTSGTYYYDEENEEVTVTLPEFGTRTFNVTLSIPQIDFMDLPHRR